MLNDYIKLTAIDQTNRTRAVIINAATAGFNEVLHLNDTVGANNKPPARARSIVAAPFGTLFVTETIEEIWGMLPRKEN